MKAILTTILMCAINVVHVFADQGADVKIYALGQQQIAIESLEPASGGNGEYQYQWERKSGNGNWQNITGATDSTLTVTGDATHYRRKVRSVEQTAYSNTVIIYDGSTGAQIDYQGDSICVLYPCDKSIYLAYGVKFSDPADQIYKLKYKQDNNRTARITLYFKPNHSMTSFDNISVRLMMRFDSWDSPTKEVTFTYTQPGPQYELQNSAQASIIQYRAQNGGNPQRQNIYYDQLGRVSQFVNVAASPSGGDVVSFTQYDKMGRANAITFLPYVRQNNNGQKVSDPLAEQQRYYDSIFAGDPDAAYAYSRVIYDSSSLNLVLGQTSPGEQSNKTNGNIIRSSYRLNTSDDAIKIYQMAGNNKDLAYSGYYAPNTLSVKIIWTDNLPDSLTNIALEYTNPKQQLVAKEIRLPDSRRLLTYYIYDDMGRQRYVVPPIQDALLTSSGNYDYETLKKYCFYNEYDEYGNNTKQYIPGMEPIYKIYDKRQRLVMIQSGTKRQNNEWDFVKFDDYNRPVISGTLNFGTYESHYAAIQAQEVFGEQRTNSATGYTDQCYPTGIDEKDILNITYYDDYKWIRDNKYRYSVANGLNLIPSYNIEGYPTGSKTRILGSGTDQWQTSATYYDYQYRQIQSISDLYPYGIEYVSNLYNFTGDIVTTRVTQVVKDKTYRYEKWFTYDNTGLLQKIEQEIKGDTVNGKVIIASYQYNDRGQISQKSIHNNIDTTIFDYRLNGKTTAVISDAFSYKLGFDRPADTGMSSRPDGYLASVAWGAGTTIDKGYNYGYDVSGQLFSAGFTQKTTGGWHDYIMYNERDIIYDLNGNITSLKRYGQNGEIIHDIQYNYDLANNGNAVSNVILNNKATTQFEYNANGNMTKDGLTGVNIKYNAIDLPEKIFAGTDTITYIYNAHGEKLATIAAGSSTYYRSVMTYSVDGDGQDQLLYIQNDEGLIAYEGNGYTYKYFKKDHLGSVRVMLAAKKNQDVSYLDIEQSTNFYPYGLAWDTNNLHLNKFLYNGKEFQDGTVGNLGMLGFYDFGSRYYHPILGRWFGIDPALQGVNPYAYCGNNPIMFVDPNGEFFWVAAIVMGAFIGGFANSVVASLNGRDAARAFFTGMISGALGGAAGAGIGTLLVSGGSGFIGGAITGAVGGFVGGSTNAWLNGASFSQGFGAGLIGGGAGALLGGLIRGTTDYIKGYDFLHGAKIEAEVLATNTASESTTYDQKTLADMAAQAQADAKYLWDARPGKNGLMDISTTLDAAARKAFYTENGGDFINGTGNTVDGVTRSYSSGKSKVYISPNTAASRTSYPFSNYSYTSGTIDNLQYNMLSCRYVGTLGHELIHVENWYNGGYLMSGSEYVKYSEHAAYQFTKHVYSGNTEYIRALDNLQKSHGWTTPHPIFRKTSIFTY